MPLSEEDRKRIEEEEEERERARGKLQQGKQERKSKEGAGFGLALASFIIPPIGWILGIVFLVQGRKKAGTQCLVSSVVPTIIATAFVLFSVAAPRYGSIMQSAREGATKGTLGAMRSGITVYYGLYSEKWPTQLQDVVTAGCLTEIPEASDLGRGWPTWGDFGAYRSVYNVGGPGSKRTFNARDIDDTTAWIYWPGDGTVMVNKTGTDKNGEPYHSW